MSNVPREYSQNIEQLSSETHSRVRGEDNRRMAASRERAARREIARLRKFAMRKPGRVQDACLETVLDMEAALDAALS